MSALARLVHLEGFPRAIFAGSVRTLRRRFPPSRRHLDFLEGTLLGLEQLAHGSERDFLDLGDRLQRVYEGAEEISRSASLVAGLLAGEELAGIGSGFQSIATWTEEREQVADRDVSRLRSVLELLSRVRAELMGFRDIVRVLNVLCVSTRIESSRLIADDMGFEILAGDVRKLAREVESSCGTLAEKRLLLSELIEESLFRMKDLETGRKLRIRNMVDGIRTGLATLSEKHGIASAGARRIAERYRAISSNIGAVVASLQFHDITRQRIEHADQAVDNLLPGATGRTTPTRATEKGRTPVKESGGAGGFVTRIRSGYRSRRTGLTLLGDVCELHGKQLDHARKEVLAAIGAVVDNLREIGRHLREIAGDSGALSGTADEVGQASLKDLSEGVAAVAEALSDYTRADQTIKDSLKAIGDTLTEMSAFADGIAVIGIKIRLIALNAIVKSCHMGGRGASLGVLAEAIHTLSVDTGTRTAAMVELLRAVTKTAETLTSGDNAAADETIRADRATVRLEEMRRVLPELNGRILGVLGGIHSDGNALAQAVDGILDGIVVHRRFDRVLGDAVGKLQEAAEHARASGAGSASAEAAVRLKEIEASYTMERERQVHERMAERGSDALLKAPGDTEGDVDLWAGGGEDPGAQNPEKGEEEDLGDNVELF